MRRFAIALLVALLTGCGAGEPQPAAVSERPSGTLVLASDQNRLTVIDVASGRRATRRIRSIPGCGAQLVVTGGHIVFSALIKGMTTVFSIPLALDRAPTRLGTAHQYAASTADGRVWLTGTDCDRTGMVGVREVTVGGEVTFESDARVPGGYLAGATPDGLVLSRRGQMAVWDPVTGTIRPTGLFWADAVQGSLVAGCAAGSDCDDLTIVDSASGRRVPVPGELDAGGTFSPDGSLLAVPAVTGRRWRVALVDPRSGRHSIVPGSRTGRNYPELRWSRTGWLFIRDARRVRAYRPGAARAETLPLRLPSSVIGFTAA